MKTKGDPHQLVGLDRSEGKRNFAYFMKQGTGKSWTCLADAERAFVANKIDAIVVFAPKGVHTNWTRREIPMHLGADSICYAWGYPAIDTKKGKQAFDSLFRSNDFFDRPTLRVLTVNFEAMRSAKTRELVDKFINCFRTMAIVDESKKIGNVDAQQTKHVIKAGRAAVARRILSGKPLTKAPMDLFSQFDFLKEGLLGTTSYRAFVSEYAILKDMSDPRNAGIVRKIGPRAVYAQIVETDPEGNKQYKNLDRLNAMLQPHMYRCGKEVLNLPPKVYEPRHFELSDASRKIYDALKNDYEYVSQTEGVMSMQAIAARTKMKQVTSGFVNVYGEPEYLKENPRMEAFLDVVDDIEGQFIVWAIFRDEISKIVEELTALGISCVEYHGGVSNADREKAIDEFQAAKHRAFVCNKAAYAGLTLTAAQTAVYYSCDFDNDVRGQSEDRNHRRGTKDTVTYIDLIAIDTIDEDIQQNLAFKDALEDIVIDGKKI